MADILTLAPPQRNLKGLAIKVDEGLPSAADLAGTAPAPVDAAAAVGAVGSPASSATTGANRSAMSAPKTK